jgi:membrane-associated protein
MLDWLKDAFHFLMDVRGLIQWGGMFMVCAIVFVETGLFVGFFLPGDSLLVTAGLFAAKGDLNVWWLLILVSICAVVGDQVGYVIGRTAGQALYSRPDSFFFRKKHLEKAHEFYEKYGGKTIVLARFIPIIRTFAPAVAGAAAMNYSKFVFYNIAGGVLWVWSMILLGFFLGRSIPNLDKHIHYVIVVVVFLSILPGIIEFWRARRAQTAA